MQTTRLVTINDSIDDDSSESSYLLLHLFAMLYLLLEIAATSAAVESVQ